MPNLADTVARAALTLRLAGVAEAVTEARILCASILGIDRAQLLAQERRILSADERARLETALARRATGEPIARILGQREFWSLNFAINASTLVPRPDSETLIDAALSLYPDRDTPLRILDLGTGTGCLLLALLMEFPHATGIGVDSAPDAVKMAAQNAAQLSMSARGKMIAGDWNNTEFVQSLLAANKADYRTHGHNDFHGFDLIISNPPYIAHDVIATLEREVRDHDPLAALDGGEDGLDAYRTLAQILPALWRPNSHALFEIGYDQAKSVAEIFIATGIGIPRLRRDLAGQPRCLILQNTQVI